MRLASRPRWIGWSLALLVAVGCATGTRSRAGEDDGAAARDAAPDADGAPRDATSSAPADAGGAGPSDASRAADGAVRADGSPPAPAEDASTGDCPDSPCRLVAPQCGCDSGRGCYPQTDGSRSCEPAGSAAEGEGCNSIPACAPGLMCAPLDDAGTTGACHRLCSDDRDCEGPGSLCVLTFEDASGSEVPELTACTRSCDPVEQTGCPPDAYCSVGRESAGEMRWLTDCAAPAGSGARGDECDADADCEAGFACVDPDGSDGSEPRQCLRWCRVGDGTSCQGLETCVGLDPAVELGDAEYGLCY